MKLCVPSGGCGNTLFISSITNERIRVSCVVPGQPTTTKVNNMSKLHTNMTFCVGNPFLPI